MWVALGVAVTFGILLLVLGQALKEPPKEASSPYVREVTEADFEAAVIETSKQRLVVVDFWASWCGPCRILTPRLERVILAQQGRALLAKVDIDENPQLSGRYEVQAVPTLLFFRGGEVVERVEGVRAEPELNDLIEALQNAS